MKLQTILLAKNNRLNRLFSCVIEKRKAIIEGEGKNWTDEMEARISFGHLCLYNRLNVSMSRQKKLLIVAGDSGLLQNDLAKEFIPGLVDFLKLCQTEGRILQCR